VPLRQIIHDPIFTQDFEMYQQNYPEMDLIYAATVHDLQEQPSIGVIMSETFWDFRIYLTGVVGNAPAFNIMYRYDTERIYLYSIKVARL
jgi:hypothetical protein